jgi:hypothetical protein
MGMLVGLLLYNQVLFLVGSLVVAQYLWVYVLIMFIASIAVAFMFRRSFRKDINDAVSSGRINTFMGIRTFISGFLMIYSMLGIISTVAYIGFILAPVLLK